MKTPARRWIAATLAAACIVSSVGCYYPAGAPNYQSSNYNADSKGYDVSSEPVQPPQPPQQAQRYGVDPALAVAGVAAAGVIGYALGNHSNYPRYYGPAYYPGPVYYPVPRGPVYYGRGGYGRRYYR